MQVSPDGKLALNAILKTPLVKPRFAMFTWVVAVGNEMEASRQFTGVVED